VLWILLLFLFSPSSTHTTLFLSLSLTRWNCCPLSCLHYVVVSPIWVCVSVVVIVIVIVYVSLRKVDLTTTRSKTVNVLFLSILSILSLSLPCSHPYLSRFTTIPVLLFLLFLSPNYFSGFFSPFSILYKQTATHRSNYTLTTSPTPTWDWDWIC